MRAHWPHLPNANCRMGTGALLQWYYRPNGALWQYQRGPNATGPLLQWYYRLNAPCGKTSAGLACPTLTVPCCNGNTSAGLTCPTPIV